MLQMQMACVPQRRTIVIKDNNGPAAPYPGPSSDTPDTGEGHGSGLERTSSEPKQGVGSQEGKKPEDWNPPAGNPGSDQDSQVPRENGTAKTE